MTHTLKNRMPNAFTAIILLGPACQAMPKENPKPQKGKSRFHALHFELKKIEKMI